MRKIECTISYRNRKIDKIIFKIDSNQKWYRNRTREKITYLFHIYYRSIPHTYKLFHIVFKYFTLFLFSQAFYEKIEHIA